MEENLDKNNEVNKEISDKTTNSNSEEIKGPKSEKVINMDINNGDSATKVVIKNQILKKKKNLYQKKILIRLQIMVILRGILFLKPI